MKKLFLLVASLCCLIVGTLGGSIESFAAENERHDADELDKLVQNIVEDLADFRNNQFFVKDYEEIMLLSRAQKTSYSKKVVEDSVDRAAALSVFERDLGVSFQDVRTTFKVLDYEFKRQNLSIRAYEWVSIRYKCNGFDELDEMGYGVYHDIVVNTAAPATPILKTDRYSEPIAPPLSDCQGETDDNYLDNYADEPLPNMRGIVALYSGYSYSSAVSYADQYCGNSTPGTSQSGNNYSGYNPLYTYYPNLDCANFVSQCLYAGGVSPNDTWGIDTTAWIQVASFHNYWSTILTSAQIVDYCAVPGNPVYWLNGSGSKATGHLMICVGHNSAGVALVDGHNDDMYRFPINASVFSNHTLLTMKFSYCSHAWIFKGGEYFCLGCGLHGAQLPY